MANQLQAGATLLVAAARTSDFWWTVMRHAIPVIGVWSFGWSGVGVAVFFVLESWLFLTSRLTLEVTFDDGGQPDADGASGSWRRVRAGLGIVLLAAPILALMLFAFGGFVLLVVFPDQEWQAFVTDGWRRVSFQVSLGLLLLDVTVDAISFSRRAARRTSEQRFKDDRHVRMMFYRVAALMVSCLLLSAASALGFGAAVLVLVISLILIVFEVFPRRAMRYFDTMFHGAPVERRELEPPGYIRRADLDKHL